MEMATKDASKDIAERGKSDLKSLEFKQFKRQFGWDSDGNKRFTGMVILTYKGEVDLTEENSKMAHVSFKRIKKFNGKNGKPYYMPEFKVDKKKDAVKSSTVLIISKEFEAVRDAIV